MSENKDELPVPRVSMETARDFARLRKDIIVDLNNYSEKVAREKRWRAKHEYNKLARGNSLRRKNAEKIVGKFASQKFGWGKRGKAVANAMRAERGDSGVVLGNILATNPGLGAGLPYGNPLSLIGSYIGHPPGNPPTNDMIRRRVHASVSRTPAWSRARTRRLINSYKNPSNRAGRNTCKKRKKSHKKKKSGKGRKSQKSGKSGKAGKSRKGRGSGKSRKS
jgi:hypothetical protein